MTIGYGLAFVAGVATFFATCLLPVLPVYIAYLSGLSVIEDVNSERKSRATTLTHSVIFIVGFLMVFCMLGFAATAIGRAFAEYRESLQRAGGMLIVLFGLSLIDVIRIPFISRTYRFFAPSNRSGSSYIGALLFGMTFGFAWVPCIGPVLATILFLVSLGTDAWYGMSLLAVFALGLGVPFLALGFFIQYITPSLAKLQRSTRFIQPFLGLCIIVIGVLLITDTLSILSRWSLQLGGTLVL